MLRTVGYTVLSDGLADEYSRSRTAWLEECCVGMEVSDVALGTLVGVVVEGIEVWSSVHQP